MFLERNIGSIYRSRQTLTLNKIAGYCSDTVLRAHSAILDAAQKQKSLPLGGIMARAQVRQSSEPKGHSSEAPKKGRSAHVMPAEAPTTLLSLHMLLQHETQPGNYEQHNCSSWLSLGSPPPSPKSLLPPHTVLLLQKAAGDNLTFPGQYPFPLAFTA